MAVQQQTGLTVNSRLQNCTRAVSSIVASLSQLYNPDSSSFYLKPDKRTDSKNFIAAVLYFTVLGLKYFHFSFQARKNQSDR